MSASIAAPLPVDSSTEQSFLAPRACPNCGGAPSSGRPVQAIHPAETMPFADLRKAWRGFFRESCFFSYFRCASCHQLFAPNYLTPDAMQQLYSEMDDNIHSGDEHLSRLTQNEYCATAAQYLPQARTYCEIGPDIGLFLDAARKRYPIGQTALIEPNRNVWLRLQDASHGIKTTILPSIEADDGSIADGSIDLMVAIHVLDHLLTPADTIQWVKRKLSPTGIALFVVHDERSLLARLLGRSWPAYCMQHPHLYNPATLKNAMTQQGLQVKRVLRTANHFPLGYLINHALFAATKKRFALDWLSWPVRIKLGNLMTIVSR